MEHFEYYPEEIAETLCKLAFDYDNKDAKNDCEEVIANLKAIVENPYNHESYRTFYKVLEKIVEAAERKTI